jgi:hypothetical protein
MSLADRYCENIHKNIEPYYATWLPTVPVKLGDYGKMDGKIFIRQGNITTDFGVNFTVEADQDSGDFEYKSSGTNAVNTNAGGGGTVGLVKALLTISFTNQGDVFFVAANCLADLMNNVPSVVEQLTPQFKAKKMKGYMIVTQVVKAGASTIAVSSDKGSQLVIEASAPDIPSIDLKSPQGQFSVKSEQNISFKVVATAGLNPLFQLEEVGSGGLF